MANLISLLLFIGFALHYSLVELPRKDIPQLDPANVSYCLVEDCGGVFGVQLQNGESVKRTSTQQTLGVLVTLELTNNARYEGTRELWLKLESPTGATVEMASTVVSFDLKNRTIAEFLVTGLKAEILAGNLYLGY